MQSDSQTGTECRCCSHSLGWQVYKDLLPFSWFAMVGIFVQIGYADLPQPGIFLLLPLHLLHVPTSQWGFCPVC